MTDRKPWDVRRWAHFADHVVPVGRQPELLADRQAVLRRQLDRLRKVLPSLGRELSQPQTREFAGRAPFDATEPRLWVPQKTVEALGRAQAVGPRIERILAAPTVRRHMEIDHER